MIGRASKGTGRRRYFSLDGLMGLTEKRVLEGHHRGRGTEPRIDRKWILISELSNEKMEGIKKRKTFRRSGSWAPATYRNGRGGGGGMSSPGQGVLSTRGHPLKT